jgi:hypothetical protein
MSDGDATGASKDSEDNDKHKDNFKNILYRFSM